MSVDRRRNRFRQWLRRGLTAALVATPIVLITGWMMFQHKPAWYRPARLDEAGRSRARNEALAVADWISDHMAAGQPFDLVLSDRTICEWLTTLFHGWSEARDALPRQLRDGAIGFQEEEILIGLHGDVDGWQAILNMALTLEPSPDGRELKLSLKRVQGGFLPAPRFLLANLIDPLLRRTKNQKKTTAAKDQRRDDVRILTEPLRFAMRNIASINDLYAGVVIPNRFTWFNGRRPFRIDAIAVTKGQLRLRINPL